MKRQSRFWIASWIVVSFIVAGFSVYSNPIDKKKKLTYEQAFQYGKPRLTGSLPSIRGWLDDQNYLEFKKDTVDSIRKFYKVNAQSGKERVFLDPNEYEDILPKGFSLFVYSERTDDYSRLLYNRDNDLYYLNTKTKTFQRLTATPSPEKNPTFSPDGQWIAYTRNHDLFTLNIQKGLEYQLTSDGSETVYNGWASWVYYEEILGRSSRYKAFYWSPDSKMLAFLRFDDSPVPKFPLFRAKGQHGELEIERYPKAGDPNPKVRLGMVTATGGDVVWADFAEDFNEYLAWVFWTPDSETLTCQWMNRDQTHLKIYTIDLKNGKKKEIYDEQQDSWVNFLKNLYFFKDGKRFLVHSDKDGWSHLYVYNMSGQLQKRLTKGEWRVKNIELVDEKNDVIYFSTDKDASTESHLYRVNIDGGGLKKLTRDSGVHRIRLSPKGSYFIDTFSNIETPSQMMLHKTGVEQIRELGDTRLPIMDEYDLATVELFRIPIDDGYRLPAKWFLPPDFDANKKYPLIFTIYGGPNATGVYNSFPYSLRSFYLAQKGVIVIRVDHRGSGHFGKKGVSEMHRNLGKWEMHDWIEAIKWLGKKSFVDTSRIGITGGSYGGYATLLALTYGRQYFTHGISLYPVTRWRLYDTVYTERYMDRPQDNPEGYEFGSVLTHADKLKGKLLLVHGTMDDNVHMQNSVQLVDKFIQLNKQFEFMIYPGERHGVGGGRSHLNQMMHDFWMENFFDEE